MASLVLAGDTSGSITVAAPAVAGSNTQTLVATTGTLAPIVSGTTITLTNQTAPEFTGIPSWVKRITVMFNGVSTNGTSNILIQLGDSGGVENTGYASNADQAGTGVNSTAGFITTRSIGSTAVNQGLATIGLISANTWAISGALARSDSASGSFFAGSKTLSDVLTTVRITTVNGTDQFDAGSINILYE